MMIVRARRAHYKGAVYGKKDYYFRAFEHHTPGDYVEAPVWVGDGYRVMWMCIEEVNVINPPIQHRWIKSLCEFDNEIVERRIEAERAAARKRAEEAEREKAKREQADREASALAAEKAHVQLTLWEGRK